MKFQFRVLIVFSLLFSFINQIIADPPGPPDPGGGPGPGDPPVGAPIDSDIFVLLILGVAYGLYKLWEHNKKNAAALKESNAD